MEWVTKPNEKSLATESFRESIVCEFKQNFKQTSVVSGMNSYWLVYLWNSQLFTFNLGHYPNTAPFGVFDIVFKMSLNHNSQIYRLLHIRLKLPKRTNDFMFWR